MRMLKRATVIHGIAMTKCRIKSSQITARNKGNNPPQTISTPQDFPISAMYLCTTCVYSFETFRGIKCKYFLVSIYFVGKKLSNLQYGRLRIDGPVNGFVDKNVLFDVHSAHLIPMLQRHIRSTSNKLATPVN